MTSQHEAPDVVYIDKSILTPYTWYEGEDPPAAQGNDRGSGADWPSYGRCTLTTGSDRPYPKFGSDGFYSMGKLRFPCCRSRQRLGNERLRRFHDDRRAVQ